MTKNDRIPPELAAIRDVAVDLRWTGSQFMDRIWKRLDPEAWTRSHNSKMILRNAHATRLEKLFADENTASALADWLRRREEYLTADRWFQATHADSGLKPVAYFSMEFGLSEALPIHSGGLGILAGDHLKSASDLGAPVIGIGLLYQQGYFRQVIGPDGDQLEALPYNDPSSLPIKPTTGPDGRYPRVRLPLPGRTLFVKVWEVQVGRTRLYLLDTNDPHNTPWDRGITSNLYAAGPETRLLQEVVLGAGGWQLLGKLGIDVDVCHLNEGHAAFAVLARAASYAGENGVPFAEAMRATRAGNVFTTHTPVPAAFDRFDPAMLATYAAPYLEQIGLTLDGLLAYGRANPDDANEPFNMAYLAMRGSCHVNAVSRLHGEVSRRLFHVLYPDRPANEVPVAHITNGVHLQSWDSDAADRLARETYGAGWLSNVEGAAQAIAEVDDARLWDFRAQSRHDLVRRLRRRYERQLRENGSPPSRIERARHVLDANILTVGLARRFTEYKRPTLLLTDRERLARLLCDDERPVQFVIAGKAHPKDTQGKEMVKALARFADREDVFDRIVFLQDYDIALAKHMVGGVDVWLNTPRVPNEACGTSGMKVLVNGGLHCSTLDGWWSEAYEPGNGWRIGDGAHHNGEHDAADAEELYALLEGEIRNDFYDRDADSVPRRWIDRVRRSLVTLAPRFSSDRMVKQYVEQAYLPAAAAFRRRIENGGALAKELEAWSHRVRDDWHGLRFVDIVVEESGDGWFFDVRAYLGDLEPNDVRIEIYTEHGEGTVYPMKRDGPIPGTVNGFRYLAVVPGDRPADHYTPRLTPFHADAVLPLESGTVLWSR